MKKALELRKLAYWLQPDPTEEWGCRDQSLLTYKSLNRLRKNRPILAEVLRSVGPLLRKVEEPKLQMWRAISGDYKQINENNKEKLGIQNELFKTEAWKRSVNETREQNLKRIRAPWGYKERINNSKELIKKIRSECEENKNTKIVFWHHHDNRGRVPKSWISTFKLLKEEDWIVIVSSTGLDEQMHEYLTKLGAIVTMRANIGICLGAYKDFCCLLGEDIDLKNKINSLILANDSTLPIKGAKRMSECLKEIDTSLSIKQPILAGLTDSIERGKYHVQSYLLGINKEFIQMQEWDEFWGEFDINGNKDELIDRGEIGLSQMALNNGVRVWARYSLLESLLTVRNVKTELQRYGVKRMHEINQTLTCWKSLLTRGFPLIKKQILLDPPVQPIPITELHEHLTDAGPDIINDIEELLRSKYLNT